MDEKGKLKDNNYVGEMPSSSPTSIQRRNRVDKIADIIVLILAIVFALLLCLVWFTVSFDSPLYADQQLVDESEDPLAAFDRYTCPLHYGKNAPFAVSSTFAWLYEGEQNEKKPISKTPTMTEYFLKFFVNACELQKDNAKEMSKIEERNPNYMGPNETAFWRDILEDAFQSVGGFRYNEIDSNFDSLNASEIWRNAGRLRRFYGSQDPFSIIVTDDKLSPNKILALGPSSYFPMYENKNQTDGSSDVLEFEKQLQQAYYPTLSAFMPIMLEGTEENITSPNVTKFMDGFLKLFAEYKVAQMRINGGSKMKLEKRKFSDVQRNAVKEAKADIYTLGQLTSKFPHIGFRPYLEGLLDNASHPLLKNASLKFFIPSADFLPKLDAYFAKGKKSLQQFRIYQIIGLVTNDIALMLQIPDCERFITAKAPHMISYYYVRKFAPAEAEYKVYAVNQMVKTIMEEYKAAIKESDWLTETSKNNLAQKLKSMAVSIGWPEWFKPFEPLPAFYSASGKENRTSSGVVEFAPIDEYHQPWFRAIARNGLFFDQMPEFLQSLLRINDIHEDAEKLALYDRNLAIYYGMLMAITTTTSIHELNEIGQKADRKEGMNAAEMNAQYMQTRNALSISYRWIDTYFKAEQMVESYGKIGQTIAHEIGHGFDNNGMLFGPNGDITEKLLDKKSAQQFDEIQKCVVNLYSKECCTNLTSIANGNETKICIDGYFTQKENFADISGITIAYRAFKKRNDLLHGGHFELSKRKFWVGYAGLYCSAPYPAGMNEFLLPPDPHPPDECRIRLSTKSVPQFAYDFNAKSPMINDGQRCTLWTI